MSHDEQLVGTFYRRLVLWCVLRQSVAAVTAWVFLWGTAVLALKVTQGTSPSTLLWGALGLPLAVGAAAWVTLRRPPDRSAVRALLDGRCARGGLLMAGAECDLGPWAAAPAPTAVPRLHWRGRRALGFLAAACAYVALAFGLPARSLALVEKPLDVGGPADQLDEQVRVLREEKVLDPERAENLQQKIEELRGQSTAREPAKTLEALDHLGDVLRQAARQSAEANARQGQQLAQTGAAAEALRKALPMLSPQDTADLMKEMAGLVQQAAAENEALQDELDAELIDALKEGKLSSEQLEKLAAAAAKCKGGLSKTAKSLYKAKLIDSDQLKACEGGKCDCDALAKYLKDKQGKKKLKEGLERQEGKGGVDDDGPGETPLTFGDRSTDEGAKFKEEALPPAELAALKESQLSGVSKAQPTRDPKAGAPQAGGLTGAAAGGGSANAAPVLPQHRGAVGRYFDRPGK
jgi:hypothetical protein